MTIGARVFLGYFVVVGLGVYFLARAFTTEVKPSLRQSAEDTLVDTANLLAEIARDDLKNESIEKGRLGVSITDYNRRRFHASIWGVFKERPSYRVYVTNDKGIVVYDSQGTEVGKDHSKWNDVMRTLRGEYGARSSQDDPKDDRSTVMHVAAPIKDNGRIIGVLTVAKPNLSHQPFLDISRFKMARAALVLGALSLGVGLAFSAWLSRSIGRIAQYAHDVSEGKRVSAPQFLGGELAKLGRAVVRMRHELDGKAYVERYVHALTHEMKSPLAAIRGAAELLQEEMPPGDRERFLKNIQDEVERSRQIVDRLLDLAMVEQREGLKDRTQVALGRLAFDEVDGQVAALRAKNLRVIKAGDVDSLVLGEVFLLGQAMRNLIDNAVAFATPGGTLTISCEASSGGVRVRIHNDGPPIPDYATPHLFERFYSLPRADTGKKSTGLGLSFVREVASLHGGSVSVENAPADQGGVLATLSIPQVRVS